MGNRSAKAPTTFRPTKIAWESLHRLDRWDQPSRITNLRGLVRLLWYNLAILSPEYHYHSPSRMPLSEVRNTIRLIRIWEWRRMRRAIRTHFPVTASHGDNYVSQFLRPQRSVVGVSRETPTAGRNRDRPWNTWPCVP